MRYLNFTIYAMTVSALSVSILTSEIQAKSIKQDITKQDKIAKKQSKQVGRAINDRIIDNRIIDDCIIDGCKIDGCKIDIRKIDKDKKNDIKQECDEGLVYTVGHPVATPLVFEKFTIGVTGFLGPLYFKLDRNIVKLGGGGTISLIKDHSIYNSKCNMGGRISLSTIVGSKLFLFQLDVLGTLRYQITDLFSLGFVFGISWFGGNLDAITCSGLQPVIGIFTQFHLSRYIGWIIGASWKPMVLFKKENYWEEPIWGMKNGEVEFHTGLLFFVY